MRPPRLVPAVLRRGPPASSARMPRIRIENTAGGRRRSAGVLVHGREGTGRENFRRGRLRRLALLEVGTGRRRQEAVSGREGGPRPFSRLRSLAARGAAATEVVSARSPDVGNLVPLGRGRTPAHRPGAGPSQDERTHQDRLAAAPLRRHHRRCPRPGRGRTPLAPGGPLHCPQRPLRRVAAAVAFPHSRDYRVNVVRRHVPGSCRFRCAPAPLPRRRRR